MYVPLQDNTIVTEESDGSPISIESKVNIEHNCDNQYFVKIIYVYLNML